jgi:hypothetical protein
VSAARHNADFDIEGFLPNTRSFQISLTHK